MHGGRVVDDLARRADPFCRGAFHEPLEILRGVLASEMDRTLRHALVAAEGGVLADLPVGIGEAEVRIERRDGETGAAVPVRRDAWKHGLKLAQKGAGI